MNFNIVTKAKVVKEAMRFHRDKLEKSDAKEFAEAMFYEDTMSQFLAIITEKTVEEIEELTIFEQKALYNMFWEEIKKNPVDTIK